MKEWAGVEADVEFVGTDASNGIKHWTKDECGYLDEVCVDVERVGGIVLWRERSLWPGGGGEYQESGDEDGGGYPYA